MSETTPSAPSSNSPVKTQANPADLSIPAYVVSLLFLSASFLLLLVSPWQRRVQRDLWRCLQTDTRLPHTSPVQRMTELNRSTQMRACSSSRAEISLNTATNNQSCVIALLWIVCVNGDEDKQMQWSWRKSVYKGFYVLDESSLFQKADCSDSAGTPLKRFALVYRTGSHRQFNSISFQLSVLCFCLAFSECMPNERFKNGLV